VGTPVRRAGGSKKVDIVRLEVNILTGGILKSTLERSTIQLHPWKIIYLTHELQQKIEHQLIINI
jgi:hypothetical protein